MGGFDPISNYTQFLQGRAEDPHVTAEVTARDAQVPRVQGPVCRSSSSTIPLYYFPQFPS